MQVIERAEEGGFGRFHIGRGEPHHPPPPAFVEEQHGTRRRRPGEAEPGDLVADLVGKGNLERGLVLSRLEPRHPAAERPAIAGRSEHRKRARGRASARLGDARGKPRRGEGGVGEKERGGGIVEDEERLERAERFCEGRLPRRGEPVAEEDRPAEALPGRGERRCRRPMIGGPGFGKERAKPRLRLRRRHQGAERRGAPVGGGRGGEEGHLPVMARRLLQHALEGGKPARPVARGGPGIVDDEEERARPRQPVARIAHRSGEAQDDERGDEEAKREQPRGRARLAPLLNSEHGEEAERRETDLARRGRGEAEQPPQKRQDEEGGKQRGIEETHAVSAR